MKWDEFKDLIAGLSPETPLGRVVSIRLEDDKDILKHFTKNQMAIHTKWRNRIAKEKTKKDTLDALEQIKNAFIRMAGGGDVCLTK